MFCLLDSTSPALLEQGFSSHSVLLMVSTTNQTKNKLFKWLVKYQNWLNTKTQQPQYKVQCNLYTEENPCSPNISSY